jgi:CRISPR/Cas system-associated exonuclease Cas4 (RecB family)
VTGLAGILIAMGVVSVIAAWLLSRTTGMRSDVTVIATDAGYLPAETLKDAALRIRGRPDYLVRDRTTGTVYPVEVKPTRDAVELYESDALQLAAYMLLTEKRYGAQFAGYGVVRYRSSEFRVPLTPELRRRCAAVAEAIRTARRATAIHRSHEVRAKCWACSVRSVCDESLA